MKNKIILLVIILVVVLGGVYYFTTKEKTNISLETTTIRAAYLPIALPIFIAQEKGFFADAGLDVQLQKFSSANLMTEAIARNDVDVAEGIGYSTLFAFENASPNKFRIYYGTDETKDTGFSTVVVKKGITSPEQLKGKKIVIRSGFSPKVTAELIIKGVGLDLKDVELVPVDASLVVTTFAKNDISAMIDVQPFGTVAVQKGLGEVLIISPRAKYILDPMPLGTAIINNNFAAKNPKTSDKFINCVNKAIEFIRTNESESREIFQKYLELDENVAKNMPLMRFKKVSEVDKSAVGALADFEVEHKILDKKPDLQNFFIAR
jgi:NitT/TauT family transport system substrate-binding protein